MVKRLRAALSSNSVLVGIVVGYLCLQMSFDWVLSVLGPATVMKGAAGAGNLGLEMGQVASLVFFCLIRNTHFGDLFSEHEAIPFAGMTVALLILGFGGAFGASAVVGSVLFGAGYSLAAIRFLVEASRFSPRKTLIVIASGLLTQLAVGPIVAGVNQGIGCFYALFCVGMATVFVGGGREDRMVNSQDKRSCLSGNHSDRGIIPIVAFGAVVSSAYGLCTAHLSLGANSTAFALGYAIPGAVALFGLLLFYEKFSVVVVYAIGYSLMVSGLLLSYFFSLPSFLAKTLISASLGSVYILVYMMVRLRSRTASQASFSYAVTFMTITLCVAIGKQVGVVLDGMTSNAAGALLITSVVIGFGLLAYSPGGGGLRAIHEGMSVDANRKTAMLIATDGALSRRESSVFFLLLTDKAVSEIAEELFIAPSTVRAHTSRIYEKLGVHSREELKALIR